MRFQGLDKKDWLHQSSLVSEDSEKIRCLEGALLANPDDAFVWHDLGDLYADINLEKAKYCWNIAIKFYKKRLEQFHTDAKKYLKDSNHLLLMNVESADIPKEISRRFFNLGSTYYNLNEYALAADAYISAYNVEKIGIDCLYWAATSLTNIERLHEAEKYIRENLQKCDDYKSYFLLGRILWKQKRNGEAQEEFWNCIENAGNDAESLYYKHLAFYWLGSKNLSIKYLDKAVKRDSENADWVYELIEEYEDCGQFKKAYMYYKIMHQRHRKSIGVNQKVRKNE